MTETLCSFEIPAEIAGSRIFGLGGFVVISDLLDATSLSALAEEAERVRATGWRNVQEESDRTEGRGGAPARAFTSAQSLSEQWRIFGVWPITEALSKICGVASAPTGSGSYTYYEQPGDFLSLHRDIVTCDLAVITCVSENAAEEGGRLLVYPDFARDPLSRAREAGRSRAQAVSLRAGETVLLLGGIVPHEVTPMLPGQERIVSVMCYRIPAAS